MGILNVTPDSFSDGGRWIEPSRAIERARTMQLEGADIIDVGAESTRPGARKIGPEEEWERLAAVLPAVVDLGLPVSVDTVHSETARRSLRAGARMINDISGGSYDPEMNQVMADSDAQYVVQHWRGFPSDPSLNCYYKDPVADTLQETMEQVQRALDTGVSPEQIVIDPGLGFALTENDCWAIVQNLHTWVRGVYPVLIGASRKRFIRARFGEGATEGTLLVTQKCREAGVWAVRVHDVEKNWAVSKNRGE